MNDSLDRLASALSDRYRIESELGAGGMATAYLAEDVKHHRKVAVRVLRPELAAGLGAVLMGVLAWGCGLLGPNDRFDVDTSFVGTHDGGVCRFVFHAKATQPEQLVNYVYQLRGLTLIAPTTYGALTPLEDGVGSFRDSLRLSWDVSLGTQSQIGRLLRFTFRAGLFELEDEISVICGT